MPKASRGCTRGHVANMSLARGSLGPAALSEPELLNTGMAGLPMYNMSPAQDAAQQPQHLLLHNLCQEVVRHAELDCNARKRHNFVGSSILREHNTELHCSTRGLPRILANQR